MPDLLASLRPVLPPSAVAHVEFQKFGFWKSKAILRVDGGRCMYYLFRSGARADRLVHHLDTFARAGIGAQRVLSRGRYWRGLLHAGHHHVVATLVAGEPLGETSTAEDFEQFGGTLARLHSIVDRRWGLAAEWRPLHRGYRLLVQDRLRRAARQLVTVRPDLAGEIADLCAWLRDGLGFLKEQDTFHLTHGDLTHTNVLMNEHRAFLIDYDTLEFGHAGFELAGSTFWPLYRRPEQWRVFMQSYRGSMTAARLAELERHAPIFFGVAALRWGARRVHRSRSAEQAQRQADAFMKHARTIRALSRWDEIAMALRGWSGA